MGGGRREDFSPGEVRGAGRHLLAAQQALEGAGDHVEGARVYYVLAQLYLHAHEYEKAFLGLRAMALGHCILGEVQ
ncbi:MAG: hypothetical protein HY660_18335 [Armatimonadetes bacterium]|nr:hypothetical protein [Armatimonadota bacterium]